MKHQQNVYERAISLAASVAYGRLMAIGIKTPIERYISPVDVPKTMPTSATIPKNTH